MAVKSYRDLIVWQKSFELVKEVYRITSELPKEEQFGLISQVRRCVISIPSNIAEGQQRNNVKEYRQFLGIARGSAAELHTQLLLIQGVHGKDLRQEIKDLENIQKMLFALIEKLQLKTVTSNL